MNSGEQRDYTVYGKLAPLGYQQVFPDVAKGLPAVPRGARVAIIQALGADVRYRDDGTPPTADVGMVIPAGVDTLYCGDLLAIQLIGDGAEVNVSYYF